MISAGAMITALTAAAERTLVAGVQSLDEGQGGYIGEFLESVSRTPRGFATYRQEHAAGIFTLATRVTPLNATEEGLEYSLHLGADTDRISYFTFIGGGELRVPVSGSSDRSYAVTSTYKTINGPYRLGDMLIDVTVPKLAPGAMHLVTSTASGDVGPYPEASLFNLCWVADGFSGKIGWTAACTTHKRADGEVVSSYMETSFPGGFSYAPLRDVAPYAMRNEFVSILKCTTDEASGATVAHFALARYVPGEVDGGLLYHPASPAPMLDQTANADGTITFSKWWSETSKIAFLIGTDDRVSGYSRLAGGPGGIDRTNCERFRD